MDDGLVLGLWRGEERDIVSALFFQGRRRRMEIGRRLQRGLSRPGRGLFAGGVDAPRRMRTAMG
jgi:hypothetical protein